MELQAEFFLRITMGHASPAAPLMARIALNLGHDAKAHPLDLSDVARVLAGNRAEGTIGFDKLLVADYVRSAIMGGLRPWRPYQVDELKAVAESSHG